MTTISESIISWLSGYSGITSAEQVETDQVGAEAVSMGLLKAPTRNVLYFTNGDKEVTAAYLFRAKRAAAQDNMRVDNQTWLENFETWIREQDFMQNLPALSGGRKCQSIGVSESAYLLEATEAEIIYQVGLTITFYEPAVLTQEEQIN